MKHFEKNTYKACFIVHFLLFFQLIALPQDNKVFRDLFREAEYYMITEDYKNAVVKYEQLLKMDSTNSNLHFLKGYCHFNANDPVQLAINQLELATLNTDKNYTEGSYFEKSAPPLTYFLLGRAYLKNYELKKAENAFKTYKDMLDYYSFAEIEYVNRYLKSCEIANKLIASPLSVTIQKQYFNNQTGKSVNNPVVSGNDSVMIFNILKGDEQSIAMTFRLDSITWSEPVLIGKQLDLRETAYPASLSYSGKTLFLVVKDDVASDLYQSQYENGQWTEAQKLGSHVNTKYLETHASISSDNKTLYFTSNRKGGWGGMDIYKTTLNKNDKWEKPVNLGFGINTYYNEETPFISHNDSILFFSSEGHETMGGYDVFYTKMDEEGDFTDVNNIGYPISTTSDDLFFYPLKDQNKAYFSRGDSLHPEDKNIYAALDFPLTDESELKIAELFPDAEGHVIGKEEDENLSSEDELSSLFTESDSVTADSLITERNKNEDQLTALDKKLINEPEISDKKESPDIIGKKKEQVQTKASENKTTNRKTKDQYYYVLNNIPFDFNSWSLNSSSVKEVERLTMMMKMHESVHIELIGKADSVGSFEYNYELAKKRALTVKNALVSAGISPDRILLAAQGEAFPVALNTSKDGTDSRTGRALNRSVSIRINNEGLSKVQIAEIFVPPELVPEQDKTYCIFLAESDKLIDSIPETLDGIPVSLIFADKTRVYTLGNFSSRLEAISHLDKILDIGYTDAGIMEKRKFEHVIRDRSKIVEFKPFNYTIQILALKNPAYPSSLKDVKNVTRYECKDGFIRYAAGEYRTVEEARNALESIRNEGLKNAFIRPIIYYDVMAK